MRIEFSQKPVESQSNTAVSDLPRKMAESLNTLGWSSLKAVAEDLESHLGLIHVDLCISRERARHSMINRLVESAQILLEATGSNTDLETKLGSSLKALGAARQPSVDLNSLPQLIKEVPGGQVEALFRKLNIEEEAVRRCVNASSLEEIRFLTGATNQQLAEVCHSLSERKDFRAAALKVPYIEELLTSSTGDAWTASARKLAFSLFGASENFDRATEFYLGDPSVLITVGGHDRTAERLWMAYENGGPFTALTLGGLGRALPAAVARKLQDEFVNKLDLDPRVRNSLASILACNKDAAAEQFLLDAFKEIQQGGSKTASGMSSYQVADGMAALATPRMAEAVAPYLRTKIDEAKKSQNTTYIYYGEQYLSVLAKGAPAEVSIPVLLEYYHARQKHNLGKEAIILLVTSCGPDGRTAIVGAVAEDLQKDRTSNAACTDDFYLMEATTELARAGDLRAVPLALKLVDHTDCRELETILEPLWEKNPLSLTQALCGTQRNYGNDLPRAEEAAIRYLMEKGCLPPVASVAARFAQLFPSGKVGDKERLYLPSLRSTYLDWLETAPRNFVMPLIRDWSCSDKPPLLKAACKLYQAFSETIMPDAKDVLPVVRLLARLEHEKDSKVRAVLIELLTLSQTEEGRNVIVGLAQRRVEAIVAPKQTQSGASNDATKENFALIKALGTLQCAEAVPFLAKLARQGGDLQDSAFSALAAIGSEPALAIIHTAMDDAKEGVRRSAKTALVNSPGFQHYELVLSRIINSQDYELAAIVPNIGDWNLPAALPLMRRALVSLLDYNGEDPDVYHTVTSWMGGVLESIQNEEINARVAAMVNVMGKKHSNTRFSAALYFKHRATEVSSAVAEQLAQALEKLPDLAKADMAPGRTFDCDDDGNTAVFYIPLSEALSRAGDPKMAQRFLPWISPEYGYQDTYARIVINGTAGVEELGALLQMLGNRTAGKTIERLIEDIATRRMPH